MMLDFEVQIIYGLLFSFTQKNSCPILMIIDKRLRYLLNVVNVMKLSLNLISHGFIFNFFTIFTKSSNLLKCGLRNYFLNN